MAKSTSRTEHKLVLPVAFHLNMGRERNHDVVVVGPGEVWVDEDVANHPYLKMCGFEPQDKRTVRDGADDAEDDAAAKKDAEDDAAARGRAVLKKE